MTRMLRFSLAPAVIAITSACSSMPSSSVPDAPGAASSAGNEVSCNAASTSGRVTAGEVLASCGQPSYRDSWGTVASATGTDLAPVEEWYYNPGPQGSVQVLRFLNGQLIAVNEDGAGFENGHGPLSCSNAASPGLSKYRLLQACGQPLTRHSYVVDPTFTSPRSPVFSKGNALIEGDSEEGRVAVYREDLSFSVDGAVTSITLQNGRVFEIVKLASRN